MGIDKWKLFEQLKYDPFDEQREYHQSTSRFRITACGRRFGKSLKVGRDVEHKLFVPEKTIWVVGPTYALAEKEFKVVWNDLMITLGLGKDRRLKKAYNPKQGEMFIKFPWNTVIEAKSADKPETLVGEALDHVILSEAAKHKYNTWDQYIRPALADKKGSADFPSTPEGYNWYYDLWQLGIDPEIVEYASWRFPSWKNIRVFPEGRDDPEIKLLERTLTPERFAQEIGAEFGSFAGKIFPEFDDEHNIKRLDFRPELPNYMAFDFGWANPLAAVEFQVTPSDDIRVWREHYKSKLTLDEHISLLKNREQPEGYHLDLAFGDAADPEAVEQVSRKLVGCWADPNSKTNWRAGIDTMKQFMRTYSETKENETIEVRKYFVDPSCTNHIRELNNYRTKEETEGKREDNASGVADRVEDHTIDAMRYALVHLYELGAAEGLESVMQSARQSRRATAPPVGVGFGPENSDFIGAGGFFTNRDAVTTDDRF